MPPFVASAVVPAAKRPRSILVAFALAAIGCDGTISVTFSTGPQEVEVSTQSLALPAELQAGDGTVASVPCGPTGMCPPSAEVTLTCEGGVCDPAPRTLSEPVGDIIDVDVLLADTREIGLRVVDTYEFLSVAYDIALNTLTIPVGPIEIYWGPAAATAVDPALGVRHMGTVPVIAAGQTGPGQVVVDPVGAAELSDYLVGGGARIRFFAETVVDVDPGDPYPQGSVRLSVNVTIRAVGSVID